MVKTNYLDKKCRLIVSTDQFCRSTFQTSELLIIIIQVLIAKRHGCVYPVTCFNSYMYYNNNWSVCNNAFWKKKIKKKYAFWQRNLKCVKFGPSQRILFSMKMRCMYECTSFTFIVETVNTILNKYVTNKNCMLCFENSRQWIHQVLNFIFLSNKGMGPHRSPEQKWQADLSDPIEYLYDHKNIRNE